MPPCLPRSAFLLVPIVAILISARAAVLRQPRPNQLSDPTPPETSHVYSNNNSPLHPPTPRLLRGEHPPAPLKSVLRQPADSETSDGLDDFFSFLQPTALTPALDAQQQSSVPESTPEQVTEIVLEEQLQPSPFEDGPVLVVNSDNSSTVEQSGDGHLDSAPAPATNGATVSSPSGSVETDDDINPSPEEGDVGEDNGPNGTRAQATSSIQEAGFHIDSSEGEANRTPNEQLTEEDDPEPSPSIADNGSIFEILPSLEGDGSTSDGSTDNPGSPTPAPSEASTEVSPEAVALLAVDTTPQSEASRVEIDISVRSTSVTTVSQDFDTFVREYLGSETGTASENWKPVFVSAAEEIKERGTTFFVWALKYQGVLSSVDLNGDVKRLQEQIFTGGLESFLRSALATDDISVSVFNEIQRDVQDKPRVTIEDIGAVSAEGQPTSNENAATGAEPLASESTTNATGSNRKRNIWLILGTGLGFVAVVAVCVAAFVLAKRSANSPRHTIDGEELAPPTLTSFHSMTTTDSTPSRFQTGAPVNPRGATMLRNQSRLLDWRAEQAAAAERESRVEILE